MINFSEKLRVILIGADKRELLFGVAKRQERPTLSPPQQSLKPRVAAKREMLQSMRDRADVKREQKAQKGFIPFKKRRAEMEQGWIREDALAAINK